MAATTINIWQRFEREAPDPGLEINAMSNINLLGSLCGHEEDEQWRSRSNPAAASGT